MKNSPNASIMESLTNIITVSMSPVAKSFLAGSLSGTCSAVLFQPLDLVKTRVQTLNQQGVIQGNSTGVLNIFRSVIQQEKIVGLWKGTAPSVARCVPGVGLYFSSLHYLKSKFGSEHPSNYELLMMGGSARCLAGAAMLPVTVVKVRFECDGSNYKNVSSALRSIYKLEGPRGLYSGMLATLSRDVPFSALYILFYTNAKGFFNQDMISHRQLPLVHFSCGVVAGCLASMVTQPADVVKTHMQSKPKEFLTVVSTISYIYNKHGTMGFLSGLAPRTLRRTLMAALAWTLYEKATRKLGLN